MQRCLDLAAKAQADVHPNPMVGAVIVCNDVIIGEGYHTGFGKPHAEVEAIRSVADKTKLTSSTLYVSLEPCCHYEKTPPCVELILDSQIPNVVICNVDPNEKVAGRGIEALRKAGINVITGISEDRGLELNRAFITFHNQKRPYIQLKWAETKNGYMGRLASEKGLNRSISNPTANRYVHQLRSNADAVLVGTNTAAQDNPWLTTRLVVGRSPLRVAIDLEGKIPETHHLFRDGMPNLIIGPKRNVLNTEFIENIDQNSFWPSIMQILYLRNVTMLLVEGGANVLNQLIDSGMWDEIIVIKSSTNWENGILAPSLSRLNPFARFELDDNVVSQYRKN